MHEPAIELELQLKSKAYHVVPLGVPQPGSGQFVKNVFETMNVLLDSNVLVRYFHDDEPYASLVETWIARGEAQLSVLAVSEFLVGAKPDEQEGLDKLLTSVECFSVNLAIAQKAGAFRRQLLRRKTRNLLIDCLLAATAIEHGCQLATLNRKDFPFPELQFAKF